jgi:hypothetical protein
VADQPAALRAPRAAVVDVRIVERERYVAARTGGRVASRAEQEAREAAAVEEQHRLLVAIERLADRLDERAGEQRARAAHVDDLDLG